MRVRGVENAFQLTRPKLPRFPRRTAAVSLLAAVAVAVGSQQTVAGFSTTTNLSALSPLRLAVAERSRELAPFRQSPHGIFRSLGTTSRSVQLNSGNNIDGETDCNCDATISSSATGEESLGMLLRSTELSTVDGTRVRLGDYFSGEDDATVVVFLRHLA